MILMLASGITFAADVTTTNGLMVSGAELEVILSVVVSTNSPLGNLAANLSTNLQASLPLCKSPVPHKVGNIVLEPFNDSEAGLRLTVRIETRTLAVLVVRVDVNYFDPNRGYANAGTEWKQLEFRLKDGRWRLSKDLGGAIK